MSRAPKIILLDANALIHRAFHALPPLISPKGELVNAVYGFASALLRAIKDERPDYIVACYDAGRTTFRHQIYQGYKAKRRETDEALALQIPRTKDLVAALGIPLYAQKGVEADDLIGSLAKIAAKKSLQTVIVTGDNDALQLVNDSTTVYSLSRGVSETVIYNRQAVEEKIGVSPDQIIEYKALAGDASDNIPGVPGIGPKTAAELLSNYRTIANLYRHLAKLPERLKRLLGENRELMETSRALATIRTDLKIELNLREAATANFDLSKASGFFQELGFKSLLSRLPESRPSQTTLFAPRTRGKNDREFTPQLRFKLIGSLGEWADLQPTLRGQAELVLDTETVDLNGELIGISFAWGANQAAYLPLSPGDKRGLPLSRIRPTLEKILSDKRIRKIGHNLKYDLATLRRSGFKVEGIWFDTMIASGLINSQLFTHRLDDLAWSEMRFRKISIAELIGSQKNQPMNEVPLKKLAAYACEDALITWRLYRRFAPDLEKMLLKRIFYEIEMPLLTVLEKMEGRGIMIDPRSLGKLNRTLKVRLKQLERQAWRQAGGEFNLSSPAQLKKVLFERLKLSSAGIRRVKTGLSTNAENLQKLKTAHPLIPLILEYRELSKLVNTYIDALPKLSDKRHRLHTSFQQLGAATGRLSSTNPNLQNIPIRTPLGTQVRRAFVATPGYQLLGADYSQAELRVLAHLSEDSYLMEAFNRGDDFHASVGQRLGVDRRSAKAINFGVVYGQGPVALAEDLGIELAAAKEFINRYFAKFPGVVKYIEAMKDKARRDGYVETIFGRRRYLPDISSPNSMLRSAAERMAVNMPAQGSVADMMKLSMIELDRQLPSGGEILLQIHDELLLEVKGELINSVAGLVEKVMSQVTKLKVPLVVEVKTGPNWAELRKREQ